MGGDMLTALERATQDGHTLFGHNCRCPGTELLALHQSAGRCHALEEKIDTGGLMLPQARETYTMLGVQTRGNWGLHHGVNTHGVAAGCTRLRTRLPGVRPGLRGPDLVRLALERSRSARQAVDLVGDLLRRHGSDGDSALLIADGTEAFVFETAGRHWAYQEVREARAVSDVSTIRQDWDGIAPGLSSLAIENGWWSADGSKLDFAGVVASPAASSAAAMRRWGRATLLLEQQNGHIDVGFVRRVLSDHYEGCPDERDPLRPGQGPLPLCQHGESADAPGTGASLVVQLQPGAAKLAWCCPGPPCLGVYLPVLLAGDLAEAFGESASGVFSRWRAVLRSLGRKRDAWDSARDILSGLQARIDQETDEFFSDAAEETTIQLIRRATLFMRHALEQFEQTVASLARQRPRPAEAVAAHSILYH